MNNNKSTVQFEKPYLPSVILIGVILLFCSCNENLKRSNETNGDTPNIVNEVHSKDDWLFINDGQLCQHLRKITEDDKGNLWMGTNIYGLMKYDGDTLIYFSDEQGFADGRITGIINEEGRGLWIGNAKGLHLYDGKTFTNLNTTSGLANEEIWSLVKREDGGMWIGHNEGLSHYDGSTFINYSVPKPKDINANTIYGANRITSIVSMPNGELWLGTDGYGIAIFDGQDFRHIASQQFLPDNVISNLLLDSKGRLWIGTYFGGLTMFDGKDWVHFTQDGIISGPEISALYEDSSGKIWIGVENNGVYRYDGHDFTHFYKDHGLNGSVLTIYEDSKNRFWFGGWGGLFRWDGNRFSVVTREGPWN